MIIKRINEGRCNEYSDDSTLEWFTLPQLAKWPGAKIPIHTISVRVCEAIKSENPTFKTLEKLVTTGLIKNGKRYKLNSNMKFVLNNAESLLKKHWRIGTLKPLIMQAKYYD